MTRNAFLLSRSLLAVIALTAVGMGQKASTTGTLVVQLEPFNYSDGVGSTEERLYDQRQNGSLGQPHVTEDLAGSASYYLFLFPATEHMKEEIAKSISIAEQFTPDVNPYADILNSYMISDPLDALRSSQYGRFRLTPGMNTFTRVPPGSYYVIPAVQFHGSGLFSSYYLWTPEFYDSSVTVEGEGLYGQSISRTYTPVLWGPKSARLRAGYATSLRFSPHAFNMTNNPERFIKGEILEIE